MPRFGRSTTKRVAKGTQASDWGPQKGEKPPTDADYLKQLEKEVVGGCKDYLLLKGWRLFRNSSGKFYNAGGQMFTVGEKGMADNKAVWFIKPEEGQPNLGLNYTIWIEFKREDFKEKACSCGWYDGKVRECTLCGQKRWADEIVRQGGLLIRVSSVVDFCAWYDKRYGFLHTGANARGQLELLVDVPAETPAPRLDTPIVEMPKPKSRWGEL